MVTFDGQRYNWQAAGEWTLFKDEKDREEIHANIMHDPKHKNRAAYMTALAFKSGKDVISVEVSGTAKLERR